MNEGSKTMKISIMQITPDLAAEFLKSNTHNRVIKKSKVKKYSDDLRRGNWKLTHQGVAISPNGRLLDGQHRLSAIVQSGIAAQMVVALDVNEDAYEVKDRGVSRSVSEATGIPKKVIEPCGYIWRLHETGSVEGHDVKKILNVFNDQISDLHAAAGNTPRARSSAGIKAAVILRLKQNLDRHYADILDQWRAFIASDFDVMWPSVKAFYRQIIDEPQRGNGGQNQKDRAVRAWIAFDPHRKNISKIIVRDYETSIQEMRDVWQPSWVQK